MSQAYASTLNISFDVRGGLLMRQIHHWAADVFVAAIMAHWLRIFFTGAYRKPREVNWLIGIVLFSLAFTEGLFGYSLPNDLLSGTGLRILEGVLLSIPVIGTYLSFFLFGGQFPGNDIIPRLYIIHVLLIPALLLALISAHLFIMFWQKHTQMPGKGQTNINVVGQPMYPYFMAKTGAFFFFIFGVLALLSTVAQINPVWLYGPYTPASISAGSQPDFYLGLMDGAVRMWPNWTWDLAGHTVAWNVFLPALVPLGLLFTGAALWPFIEQWATGDRSEHHVNDRPRNAPARTAIGAAVVTCYGVFLLEGANDLIADHLHVSIYTITWIARVAVFAGPVIAYIVTKRICLGLQRRDLHLLEHGVETGIIRQLPNGKFTEVHRPISEDKRAVLLANREPVPLPPTQAVDPNGVPAPATRGLLGKLRTTANRVITENVLLEGPDGGYRTRGNGRSSNGHLGAGENHSRGPQATAGVGNDDGGNPAGGMAQDPDGRP
jgi:ubiquinol-cytochrome c reductase cytochrome b subunit